MQDRSPDVPSAAELAALKEAERIFASKPPTPEWQARHLSQCRRVHRQLVRAIGGFVERNDCDIEGHPRMIGTWGKLATAEREMVERIKRFDPPKSL